MSTGRGVFCFAKNRAFEIRTGEQEKGLEHWNGQKENREEIGFRLRPVLGVLQSSLTSSSFAGVYGGQADRQAVAIFFTLVAASCILDAFCQLHYQLFSLFPADTAVRE